MSCLDEDIQHLVPEHCVLLRHYGTLQRRCTEQAQAHAQEVAQLQAQLVRLRAQVILRDSALAWAYEDCRRLQAFIAAETDSPALPTLAEDIDSSSLAHSLRCADLVICQTGCISHDSFWRVQDHCKRTGKTCVLVEQPSALRIVRVHADDTATASPKTDAAAAAL